MHFTPRRALLPISIACAILMAGCGGGGSGSSSDSGPKASANSDISEANYASFASPLATTVLDIGGGASVSGFFGGTAAAQSAQAVRSALGVGKGGRATIQSATRQSNLQDSVPCDHAGTLDLLLNDANNNSQLDVGETVTVTATQCQFASTDQPMNGAFSMTVQKLQLDSQGYPSSVQVAGSFNSLSVGSDALTGGFSLSMTLAADGSETLEMGFSNLNATHGSQAVTYNLNLAATYGPTGSGSFSIDGTLQRSNEVYLLEQSQPFATVPSTAYPTSGTLRLEDAAGDALVLEAQPGDLVDFKFYPAGSTAATQQMPSVPWSTYGG